MVNDDVKIRGMVFLYTEKKKCIVNNLCQISTIEHKIFLKHKKGVKNQIYNEIPQRRKKWCGWISLYKLTHTYKKLSRKNIEPPHPKHKIPKMTFKCKTVSQLDDHIIQYLKKNDHCHIFISQFHKTSVIIRILN
jgi:hypothetical protein